MGRAQGQREVHNNSDRQLLAKTRHYKVPEVPRKSAAFAANLFMIWL